MFDAALLLKEIRKYFCEIDRLPDAKVLGRGRDFVALRYSRYAILIPHSERFRTMDSTHLKRWFSHINTIQKLESPLVPPLKVLQEKDAYGVVLPYGQGGLSFRDLSSKKVIISGNAFSLKELYNDHTQTLESYGLKDDDLPQFRLYGKIPFLIDFGDLESIHAR